MMKFSKRVIADDLKLNYAIAMFAGDDGESFLIATEKDGPCLRFDLDGNLMETVNEGPGGVMTMAQVPGKGNQFLTTQEFYSPNCGADDARISIVSRKGKNNWEVATLCDMPYVHRFGILQAADGRHYLIACTIKSACEYREDWRFPGKIFVAPLPDDLSVYHSDHQLKLDVLRDGQLKNHGFFVAADHSYCLIATAREVMKLTPPTRPGAAWDVETLLEKSVSDICLADFDEDGREELLTLSEFHGARLEIFKPDADGKYVQVYEHPAELPFLHAILSTKINGKPIAVIGHRKGERDLYIVQWNSNSEAYELLRIDHDRGPANVCAYERDGKLHIIATNRETNEVALYIQD